MFLRACFRGSQSSAAGRGAEQAAASVATSGSLLSEQPSSSQPSQTAGRASAPVTVASGDGEQAARAGVAPVADPALSPPQPPAATDAPPAAPQETGSAEAAADSGRGDVSSRDPAFEAGHASAPASAAPSLAGGAYSAGRLVVATQSPPQSAGGAASSSAAGSAGMAGTVTNAPSSTGAVPGQPAADAPTSIGDDDSGAGGGGSNFNTNTNGTGSNRPCRQALHASRYRELSPSEVAECAPHDILDGISLSQQRLGRGSFGIVTAGAYSGLRCAVKIMVANDLDKSALRELLLAPAINHANLVQTYTSRCARLTHEFFDRLEGVTPAEGTAAGNTSSVPQRDPSRPRALLPIPLQSGDGFGDPGCGVVTASDPYRVLHMVLHDFIAKTEQYVVVIVQELCTKGTLHAAIRQGIFRPSATNQQWNMRLARRALLRTSLELARGLLHLHDTGLVHGDFKPANVLLASSRDDRRGFNAKVADFGLLHVLPQHANSLTTESFGSPAYMAPEAFLGKASKATDVYSFGVCLWELLCGRTPYSDARGVRDLVADLAAGRAPALVWPDGAEMADGIIALGRRCMSQRPEDRPDFKEVVQELIQIERIIRAELLAPAVLAAALAAEPATPAPSNTGQAS